MEPGLVGREKGQLLSVAVLLGVAAMEPGLVGREKGQAPRTTLRVSLPQWSPAS